MNQTELEYALSLMGTRFVSHGKNRSAKCPLASWTHDKGRDKKPSLMARAGDPSLFKCWACQEQGRMLTLAKKYGQYSGDYQAFNYVAKLEGGNKNIWDNQKKKPLGEFGKRFFKKPEETPREITEEEFKKRFMEYVPDYAYERGLSKDQVLKWEIGYDSQERRMIFPIRDYRGRLAGVSGRDLTGLEERPKYKHYHGFKKDLFFYGERFWDPAVRRVFIMEGFFDVLAMERHGFRNVFGSMGTSLSFDQMKKIRDWFDEVVFFPDANDAGQGLKFAEESCLRLLPLNKKVRIAGVKANPFYVYRSNQTRWEKSDYRFQILENFVGKDPADWTEDDIRIAFENIGVVGLHGGIDVEFEKVDVGWYRRPEPIVEKDLLSEIFV